MAYGLWPWNSDFKSQDFLYFYDNFVLGLHFALIIFNQIIAPPLCKKQYLK
jgi:hypothetical protein